MISIKREIKAAVLFWTLRCFRYLEAWRRCLKIRRYVEICHLITKRVQTKILGTIKENYTFHFMPSALCLFNATNISSLFLNFFNITASMLYQLVFFLIFCEETVRD